MHPYFEREVSVAFLKSVSILFYGHSNLVTYHFISFFLIFPVSVNNFSFMSVHEAADKVNHFPVLSDCRYRFPALNQC